MRHLGVLVAAGLCALGGSGAPRESAAAPSWSSSAASTFSDAAGDSGTSPDITVVVVSNDEAGTISFRIEHPNQPDLARGNKIDLFLDTDQNPRTGVTSLRGADYRLATNGSSRNVFPQRWNGSALVELRTTTLGAFFGRGHLLLSINRSELGGTRDFNFWIRAFEQRDFFPMPTSDDAPNAGTWRYRLSSTRPVSLTELVERVRSGVIRIQVEGCRGRTIGSGILIGPRHVATVEHVVAEARTIVLERGGKRLGTARVVGADRRRDLALLQTKRPLSGYRFSLGARAPQVGDPVAVLGYPVGLPLSVTRGSVSGLNRSVRIEGVTRRGLVQTDAAVNRGSSGGPLLSIESGSLLGLVDIGSTQVNGIAFAVSAQVANPLLSAWKASPQPVPALECK